MLVTFLTGAYMLGVLAYVVHLAKNRAQYVRGVFTIVVATALYALTRFVLSLFGISSNPAEAFVTVVKWGAIGLGALLLVGVAIVLITTLAIGNSNRRAQVKREQAVLDEKSRVLKTAHDTAKSTFQALAIKIDGYNTDLEKILEYPLFSDTRDSQVVELNLLRAQLAPLSMTEYDYSVYEKPEDIEFISKTNKLEILFGEVEARAKSNDSLSAWDEAERKTLELAQKYLRTFMDQGDTPEGRLAHERLIKTLNSLPIKVDTTKTMLTLNGEQKVLSLALTK